MSYRASPPRRVPAFFKDGLTDPESAVADGDFVNLERSTVRHADGFAQGEYAILPDKHHYDRIRFLFGPVTVNTGTLSTLSVTVYVKTSDGSIVAAASSDVLADLKTIPPIEFENYQGLYSVKVTALTGSSEDIDLDVFVQGVNQGYVV